ncbi:hypothetical protein Q5P01_023588 [Channa striata]|uniref:CMT1A duplicated region transcript 1 protein n=1 Tax=Channa striata TaxID=64152 RepID=A0AA88IUN1_CHASR|nr:hypothetical protein Q5P01_023588 [Channa striata]
MSAEFRKPVSACGRICKSADRCPSICGMCPSCVFAPKPWGFTESVWKVSDRCKRRFVLELLLRCRNARVLDSIQDLLGVTSWTVFTYARSRTPASAQDRPCHSRDSALDRKPLSMNMNKIWDWFNSSPEWIQSRYLCRVLSLCDPELLRMVSNLTSVLLVRHKRRFLQFNSRSWNSNQHIQDNDEDSENPALMVVPGSSKSVSGVSRYRDFIGNLPVGLSKRILGLLEVYTLRCCQRVCRYWDYLATETMEEIKFRIHFQDQMKAMMMMCKGLNIASPTYANIVDVLVPTSDEDKVDVQRTVRKVMPFQTAYAKIRTKTVPMEERNVYCSAYFTKVLLYKEDAYRVLDYRGGHLMAMGSRDRALQLFYVASETKIVSVLKGHVASIRAVMLCEDRNLVITASSDASIRCWNLKTDRCEMALYGHTGSVNCLDLHSNRLASGGKDCVVKVWNLQTGKLFPGFHFKHHSSIRCVKISATQIYSSCDRGLIKIWDIEKASLVRVIDAHSCSVKCLFLDEWHLLSGDLNGQVMAWSVSCHAKECLKTFHHPKEVKSLTLIYLRVVTGCVDGKIRIFDFLTGDCLRDITAETETGCLLSLHFNENSILVNTTSNLKLYQFAKVFWDYKDSIMPGQEDGLGQDDLVSEISADSHRKMHDGDYKRPERLELLYRTCFLSTPTKCHTQAEDRFEIDKKSLMLSEKATCKRIKKRGPHHPPTRDSILLTVNSIQRAQCMDEITINMEFNARLRDSWGHDPLLSDLRADMQTLQQWRTRDDQPRRAKTCVPLLKRPITQNIQNTLKKRDVTTAPHTTRRQPPFLFSTKAQSQSVAAHGSMVAPGTFSTSAKKGLQRAETCVPILMRPTTQNMRTKPKKRDVTTAPHTMRRQPLFLCSTKAQPQSMAAHSLLEMTGAFSTGARKGLQRAERT